MITPKHQLHEADALLPIGATRSVAGPVIAVAAMTLAALAACGGSPKTTAADSTAMPTNSAVASANNAATPAAATSATTAGTVPPALDAVGTHGEDLYDAVKAGNWAKARSITDSLDASVRALPTGQSAAPQQQQLSAEVDSLNRFVSGKQQSAAIKAANQITYLEAKMTAQYQPAIPADVILLDYYGRELEIWSAEKNSAKLTETSNDIQQTWNTLRPMVEAHGGASQATRTDALVKSISSAKTPTMYASLATPFLEDVDALEKVFTK
ncbi:MAG: hypothetical protein ACR2MQ_01480 [Gemmatimonadaceae bacterium]